MAKKKATPDFRVITEANIDCFGKCCGVGEIGDFYAKGYYDEPRSTWNAETREWRSALVSLATKAQALATLRNSRYDVLMATTIPDQKHVVPALKELGFKEMAKARSHDGNYPIRVWMWKAPRKRSTRKTAA